MLFTTVKGQYYSIFTKYTKSINLLFFSFLFLIYHLPCFPFTAFLTFLVFPLTNQITFIALVNQITFIASFPLLVESYIVWFESYIPWFGLLSLTFKKTQLYVDKKSLKLIFISIFQVPQKYYHLVFVVVVFLGGKHPISQYLILNPNNWLLYPCNPQMGKKKI